MAASLDNSAEVLRQVEFYFSDSNLPRDKFLKKIVEESEDRLVSLQLICSFSRMKKHLGLDASLKPEDIPVETVLAVAELLRRSPSLRVSEDGKKVGRSTELSRLEEVLEMVDARSVAASPLPYDVKLEDVESFFSQHGKVNSVRLPCHISDKKLFCGTAVIEFAEEEDANKVLKENLVFAGADLEIKPKKEFDAEKSEELVHHNKNSSDGSYPKGVLVSFKLKPKLTRVSTGQKQGEKCDSQAEGNVMKESITTSNLSDENEQKIIESVDDPSNDTKKDTGKNEEIKSSAAADESVVKREDIREVFQRFGTIKYIDFQMGEENGYIRFEDPEAALKARKASAFIDEGGLTVKNYIAILEALTGEAEKEYWNRLRDWQKDNKGHKGRGGKHRRGGRQFDGKRSRQRDSSDNHPNKVVKVDAQA